MFHSVQGPAFLLHMLISERPKALKCRAFGGSSRSCRVVAAIQQWAYKTASLPTCFFSPCSSLPISLSWGKCISLLFPSGLMFHLFLVLPASRDYWMMAFPENLDWQKAQAWWCTLKEITPAQHKMWTTSVQMQVDTQDTEVNLPCRFPSSVGTARKRSHNPVNESVHLDHRITKS